MLQGRDIWIVKLRGVNSLNDSQLLRGTVLLVDGADRPELEDEDEFLAQVLSWYCHLTQTIVLADAATNPHLYFAHLQDLIGASVVLHTDGSAIGTVLDVYDGTGELGLSVHSLHAKLRSAGK